MNVYKYLLCLLLSMINCTAMDLPPRKRWCAESKLESLTNDEFTYCYLTEHPLERYLLAQPAWIEAAKKYKEDEITYPMFVEKFTQFKVFYLAKQMLPDLVVRSAAIGVLSEEVVRSMRKQLRKESA